jgi:hypothetical protein
VQGVQDKIDRGVEPKRSSVFYQLLNPQLNPDSELPTIDLMADEAFDFCVAGSDTTGNALTVGTYHVITNPDIYETVKQELRNCFPDPNIKLGYTVLEKLPYLTGIVRESLRRVNIVLEILPSSVLTCFVSHRLSYGVVSRLPRITPRGGATFNGYFVPEGVCLYLHPTNISCAHSPVYRPLSACRII